METALGYAKICISPPLGTKLGGYATDTRVAEGIHDDLYARVLVLNALREDICIIQTDLLDLDKEYVESLKNEIVPLGFKSDYIFIGATHTHSGPKGTNKGTTGFITGFSNVFGSFDESLFQSYKSLIYKAVKEAAENKQQCDLKYGFTKVTGVATNRNHKEKHGDPYLFALEGSLENGKKVLLYNYACHPTVMNGNNTLISADLPGGVSKRLEHSKYDMVVFINGCCGDISTRFTKSESSFCEIERLSGILAESIEKALEHTKELNIDSIGHKSIVVSMKVKQLETVEEAWKKLEGYKKSLKEAALTGKGNLRLYESKVEGAAGNLSLSKAFGGVGSVDITLSFLGLGPLKIVFIPAELFSALSNPIRDEFGFDILFFGYFNGYEGYIADKASYEAETYETLSSPYAKGEGEKLMDIIKAELHSLEVLKNGSAE